MVNRPRASKSKTINTKKFRLDNNAIAIAKKIGDSHTVWFEPSRLFVKFAPPAYRVFRMYAQNISPAEIVKKCQHDFNHPILTSHEIIFMLIAGIKDYCNPTTIIEASAEIDLIHQKTSFPVFSQKRYIIGHKFVTFAYGNSFLKQCFDPLFSQLTTTLPSENDYLFEVFEHTGRFILRSNKEDLKSFAIEEVNQLIGAVFQQIFSIMYDINAQDWMMNLHSSGISDGKSAILFPACAGSGKTTLAALLHANGFPVIADDFMAVDVIKKHTYHFPGAMSIKEGSLESLSIHYPRLSSIPFSEKAFNEKKVRYMSLENNIPGTPISFSVKAVVFLNYTPGKDLFFEKIEQNTALLSLLAETWVNPTPDNVGQFFCWLDTVQFYRLSYSENRHAIETISNLFLS